jgi:hypothetical protein
MIKLAEDLSFPIDLAGQTLLIVGKRGSGKSTTCVRIAEEFFAAQVPFVVIDPTDTWWGLKSSRDGKAPGLGVYVFGGRHQDLPLEPTGGMLAADVVIDNGISAVFSTKHFTGKDRSRFVTDFAGRLLQRNASSLHVFLEEAHEAAPQNPFKADREHEMLSRVTRIWKLGRASGLGGSAITQRPASLSKDITTQAEILIVHRMLGPQDVAAVKEWIKYHGERDDILAQLSTLRTGEAFVWAPDFPEDKPIGLRRVRILPRTTFDSSATPKAGQRRAEPKELAPVDLERLSAAMAATIERAKADDPKELRRRIQQLERELAAAKKAAPAAERVEVPVLSATQTELLNGLTSRVELALDQISGLRRGIAATDEHCLAVKDEVGRLWAEIAAATGARPVATACSVPARPETRRAVAKMAEHAASNGRKPTATPPDGPLTGPEQRILDAIAWLEGIGVTEPEQTAVAFLAGYAYGAGSFNNPKGRLRARGFVDYLPQNRIRLTDAGRPYANHPDAPLTAEAMHEHVLGRLPGPEQRVLRPLLDAYPNRVAKDALAVAAGYTPGAGSFNNPCGRLRSLGLIDYPEPGFAVARGILFLRFE